MLSPPKQVKVLTKFQNVVVQEGKQGVMGYSKKFGDNPLWPEKRLKIHQNCEKMPMCRGKHQHFLNLISLKNDPIFGPSWQILLKITFFAGKRCGGVCICPKGLISTKIFALALTVLEIFAKKPFSKKVTKQPKIWHK